MKKNQAIKFVGNFAGVVGLLLQIFIFDCNIAFASKQSKIKNNHSKNSSLEFLKKSSIKDSKSISSKLSVNKNSGSEKIKKRTIDAKSKQIHITSKLPNEATTIKSIQNKSIKSSGKKKFVDKANKYISTNGIEISAIASDKNINKRKSNNTKVKTKDILIAKSDNIHKVTEIVGQVKDIKLKKSNKTQVASDKNLFRLRKKSANAFSVVKDKSDIAAAKPSATKNKSNIAAAKPNNISSDENLSQNSYDAFAAAELNNGHYKEDITPEQEVALEANIFDNNIAYPTESKSTVMSDNDNTNSPQNQKLGSTKDLQSTFDISDAKISTEEAKLLTITPKQSAIYRRLNSIAIRIAN